MPTTPCLSFLFVPLQFICLYNHAISPLEFSSVDFADHIPLILFHVLLCFLYCLGIGS